VETTFHSSGKTKNNPQISNRLQISPQQNKNRHGIELRRFFIPIFQKERQT
jgi:hypothetical protein